VFVSTANLGFFHAKKLKIPYEIHNISTDVTDRQTERQTDGRTDEPHYRRRQRKRWKVPPQQK